MSVWILNKKNVITILVVFALSIGALTLSLNGLSALLDQDMPANTPENQRKLPVYSVETKQKQVALTFNCAWGNEDIPALLEIFKRYDIKVTFFFVGTWVDKFPDSVRTIIAAGHGVGNHSDKHPDMTKLAAAAIEKDIKSCNEKIAAITSTPPLYFRAPSGAYDNKTIEAAERLGMISVQWDVDSIDWKDPAPDEIVTRVVSKVKNGSVVLFHAGKENTPKALPAIIEQLRNEGYSFVTVDELVLKENYTIDSTGRQHPKI
ncbi:MAG: polysaccharide deacetylase family protein [Oscillospiraceae bacterium]|nr:polysaccharide deacetylase family protein [Oscillospiraceae bacterium]